MKKIKRQNLIYFKYLSEFEKWSVSSLGMARNALLWLSSLSTLSYKFCNSWTCNPLLPYLRHVNDFTTLLTMTT